MFRDGKMRFAVVAANSLSLSLSLSLLRLRERGCFHSFSGISTASRASLQLLGHLYSFSGISTASRAFLQLLGRFYSFSPSRASLQRLGLRISDTPTRRRPAPPSARAASAHPVHQRRRRRNAFPRPLPTLYRGCKTRLMIITDWGRPINYN